MPDLQAGTASAHLAGCMMDIDVRSLVFVIALGALLLLSRLGFIYWLGW